MIIFYGDTFKDKVYAKNLTTLEELKIEIENELKKISKNTLYLVFQNMKKRLNLVLNNNGGHIE